MKRVEDRALAVGQMRRTAAGMPIPERQPAATDHRPVKLEPGLKLEHGIHQEPVGRLVIPCPRVAKAGRDQQHVGRAQDLAAAERLVEESRDADGQERAKGENLAARSHGAMPPCIRAVARSRFRAFEEN